MNLIDVTKKSSIDDKCLHSHIGKKFRPQIYMRGGPCYHFSFSSGARRYGT